MEKRLSGVAIEPSVYRGCAEEIGEPVPVEPLHRRVPPDDREREPGAWVDVWSPALVGCTHLVLEGRMTPVRVAGGELFVEVSGLGVHLRLTVPAHDHVAEQCHPTVGMEDRVGFGPPDGRVN